METEQRKIAKLQLAWSQSKENMRKQNEERKKQSYTKPRASPRQIKENKDENKEMKKKENKESKPAKATFIDWSPGFFVTHLLSGEESEPAWKNHQVATSHLLEECSRFSNRNRMSSKLQRPITKGEHSIIEGILTNRCNSGQFVPSHSAAWYFEEKTYTSTYPLPYPQTDDVTTMADDDVTNEYLKESKVTKRHAAGKTVIKKSLNIRNKKDAKLSLDLYLPAARAESVDHH